MKSAVFQSPSREISQITDSYVIAEIGNNHQGSVDTCIDMFRAAKHAGADAVKLQKRDNASIFTKNAYDAAYHSENAFAETYGAHRDHLEFDKNQYVELFAAAKEIGITLFCTAFDMNSADFLEKLDCPMYKVASGDLKSWQLIERLASFGKPLIISTGGADLNDVQRVAQLVMPINPNFCFLQCTAAYPCEPEDMNLSVINTFRSEFPNSVVGLSSHDNGIVLPVVAQTLGARVFEKHFTLNRTWKGTDHSFSLTPEALRKMIRDLQRARLSIGDGIKRTLPVEQSAIVKMAKKIVAARDIRAGETLTMNDLAFKSPGDGLFPSQLNEVLGRKALADIHRDEAIELHILDEG